MKSRFEMLCFFSSLFENDIEAVDYTLSCFHVFQADKRSPKNDLEIAFLMIFSVFGSDPTPKVSKYFCIGILAMSCRWLNFEPSPVYAVEFV